MSRAWIFSSGALVFLFEQGHEQVLDVDLLV
jgi:hypothetical protein